MNNPHPETIIDESSGIKVANQRYSDWEAGLSAGRPGRTLSDLAKEILKAQAAAREAEVTRTVFSHTPGSDGNGGLTICRLFNTKGRLLSSGFACCSDKDLYSGARGEAISQGRALKALRTGKVIFTHVDEMIFVSKARIVLPEELTPAVVRSRLQEITAAGRIVEPGNFLQTVHANVDEPGMSDADFRRFIRNSLPLVRYSPVPPRKAPVPKPPQMKPRPVSKQPNWLVQ